MAGSNSGSAGNGRVITKGYLANTFLLSQGLGLAEHNRAKTPEGRANQDERIMDNAANFAINLGGGITAYRFFSTVFNIASAREKTFEILYRVQGGGSKIRFQVTNNSVSINGDDMLFVNIGQKERAIEFLAKRGDDAVLLKFKVNQSFVDKLRNEAVPQNMGRLFPGKPQTVDATKAPDQYGIPKEYFNQLLNSIDPKSVQIIKKP